MKENEDVHPPRWAVRFLRWYCRPNLQEDLEGDLNEFFARNVRTKGLASARWIYVLDVFKFIRPYTLRKPEHINLFTQWIMLGSFIKISGRIILRNRLFSSINVIGLAISMAVGLVLIVVLSEMNKYDRFHENYNQIYRVISSYKYLDEEETLYASTSLRAGQLIQESVPQIEDIAILNRGFAGDMTYKEQTVPLSGHWASESFFKVFSFPLINGDASTALKNPYSVVLTEKSAKKLFGNADALGKTITRTGDTREQEFVVTGIMQDVPAFSHLKFDMLTSLSTRTILAKEHPDEMAWDNIWNGYVYVLLRPQTDVQHLQRNLNTLSAKEDQTVKNTNIKLVLQPMSEIALGNDLNNSIGPVMESSNLWMLGVLCFIVILSACFNYTNLSIARSLRRSREVGIRKVVGAVRSQVVGQFVVEAVIIALFALAFALALFVLIKPYFLSLNRQYGEMLALDISLEVIAYFILFAGAVGIIAGFFPAMFFARVNAIRVLKNIPNIPVFGTVTLRKALIVVQFTVSLMFIAATIIGYKHYRHLLAFDLGFDTEHVLNIELFRNNPNPLIKELSEMPEVKAVSTSTMITSLGNYLTTNVKYTDPQDSVSVYFTSIDEHYLPLHGHKLLAGRNFRAKARDSEESEVIVNEKLLKRFNITDNDPTKAVGEFITVNRKKLQIVGVVKDFHYGKSIDKEIKQFMFRYSHDEPAYINAKVISPDWPATIAKIETAWKKIDHVHPLEATFYDEQIARAYSGFSSKIKVIGFLSFLAICIASVGLLGMVVFTTETRLKEISIRKVLGAGEGGLIYLLSKGFLLSLAIAALIALPTTHFFFARYVLNEYAAPSVIAWNELLTGVMAVMALALLVIGTYTSKVARANPADVLKNE